MPHPLLFFNTIQLAEPQLMAAEAKAKCQEALVLETFAFIQAPMTPFDVQRILTVKGHEFPVTSIRRAMTNLTKRGHLAKSGSYRKERYGMANNTWVFIKTQ